MSFLSPWFLLGGLAIAGPILFHLIRRMTRERVRFSSILFLRPTPPPATRRRKLDDFWLLLLRCLCLLLLAAAFARPFFLSNVALPLAAREGRQIVLLLDTSASMRREGLWEKACAVAERYLNETASSDQVAILVFDQQTRALVRLADWSSWPMDQRAALARQRLANVKPAWMGTHLGFALTTAAEQFQSEAIQTTTPARRELVLITDLQEGAKLDGLQGHEWPGDTRVRIEIVSANKPGNAGISIASDRQRADDSAVALRVLNSRDSQQEKFQWRWKTDSLTATAPVEAYVSGGQTRTFAVTNLPAGARSAEFQLSGDTEAFDNTAYFVVPEIEQLKICWLGEDAANDPNRLRFYFERVFTETPRRKVEVVAPGTKTGLGEALKNSALAVVAENLTAADAQSVHDWVSSGKTAVLVLAQAQMAPTLAALAGLQEARMDEAPGAYALLGQIEFEHPIFAPFADPRFSDFAHIHFWKHRRWELPVGSPARVLAKFDDDSPALVQLGVGGGNLLILTAGWNPSDSQFAVSSKFPPLMQTILNWSGAQQPARFQFLTGDSIPAPAISGTAIEWRKPDGTQLSRATGTSFAEADAPGIYRATAEGQERLFAVNLPPEESHTAPMSLDELARLGVPLLTGAEPTVARVQENARSLQRAELESRQKLWRWLIVGALVVSGAEIFLSGWLMRRTLKVQSGKVEEEKPSLREEVA